MHNHKYDVIIVGGGPAGLTAAIYCSRSKLDTLLIEKMGCGGQAAIADWIENYPGFPEGISGFDLTQKMEEQAKKFGAQFVFEEVSELTPLKDNTISVKTTENEYSSTAVIIASGAAHKRLDIPGENEFSGKGVSYCATCDGPFFKNKDVAVVGGGNSAIQEAVYLTRFASSVNVVHRRGVLRATKILQERAFANEKVKFSWNSIPVSINGGGQVESLTVKDKDSGKESVIPVKGVFIFAGLIPNTAFCMQVLKIDDFGYLLTDDMMATSVPGIFACGDSRKKLLRQVVTAAGDGAAAAFSAQEYIDEIKGTRYK